MLDVNVSISEEGAPATGAQRDKAFHQGIHTPGISVLDGDTNQVVQRAQVTRIIKQGLFEGLAGSRHGATAKRFPMKQYLSKLVPGFRVIGVSPYIIAQ